MRKYLGSIMSVYAAVLSPCFIIFPIVFATAALHEQISVATVFLSAMCILCSFLWGYFVWKKRSILYAWGTFQQDVVYVKVLFNKTFPLFYNKCNSCGIAYYRHSLLNVQKTALGSNFYYIFLSIDLFDEKYRNQINLWAPSNKRIKVKYSKDLYDHLLSWLPSKQANMLKKDYEKFLCKSKLSRKVKG